VSLWLFRPGLLESLDHRLTTAAPSPRRQLGKLYGAGAVDLIVSRVQAFRSMHLHGRALSELLPTAIGDLDDADVVAKGVDAFEIVDGELVAGIALGWNFGEGHLHNEQLLAALQQRCAFASGEVRCIFLESQPAGAPTMHWRIADANTGRLAEGRVKVTDLLDLQPWGRP
jgi:hypothetical protein